MLIPQSTKEGRAVWKIPLVIAGALVTIAGWSGRCKGPGRQKQQRARYGESHLVHKQGCEKE